MEKEFIEGVSIKKLEERINEIREVLNEICVTVEETAEEDKSEKLNRRLSVSQYLDELIVQYMKEILKEAN
ncbi:MAG: hypothetical protein AB6733_11705 [Clostridiaceae bacterium]